MEKMAIKGTRGEAPEDTNPADTSVSEYEPPELSGNNCLCLRPPVSATLSRQPDTAGGGVEVALVGGKEDIQGTLVSRRPVWGSAAQSHLQGTVLKPGRALEPEQ